MAANGTVIQQMPAWHEAVALATLADGVPKPVPFAAMSTKRC